jgi:hypothetical protein
MRECTKFLVTQQICQLALPRLERSLHLQEPKWEQSTPSRLQHVSADRRHAGDTKAPATTAMQIIRTNIFKKNIMMRFIFSPPLLAILW